MSWNQYLEWEKKHDENERGTIEFLRSIWEEIGVPVLPRRFDNVLEIGIGKSGGILQFLDAAIKVSVDPIWGTDKIKAESMAYREVFDLVIITNALTHCDNMGLVMKNIKRSLRRGGYLFFMNFLHEDDNHPHHFCFSKQIKPYFKYLREIKWVEHPASKRNEFIAAVFQK